VLLGFLFLLSEGQFNYMHHWISLLYFI